MKHPYVSENTGHAETNWQFTNEVIFRGKGSAIIPKVLQLKMLTRIHASHLGAETCLRKARDVKY